MIQDIQPRKYDITYRNTEARSNDYVLLFDGEKVLMKQPEGRENASEFLTFEELESLEAARDLKSAAVYLFSIDDYKYFSVNPDMLYVEMEDQKELHGAVDIEIDLIHIQDRETFDGKILVWQTQNIFRTLDEKWIGFAGITALQINRWMVSHKYCGKCGKPLKHSNRERAFVCEDCTLTVYPKISPAVIVGIVDGDKLLLTRYADRAFKRYGLIAGFGEVGETLEDTVHREVLEEVGLTVKDITYYKSQPWSFSDSLLVGFFARLDGGSTVTLEEEELAEATWFKGEDIPESKEEIALTAEMIRYFVAGNRIFNDVNCF